MLKTTVLVICAMGMAGCSSAFWDELRSGRFYASPLVAAIAWTIGFFAALAFMEWE